MSLYKQKRSPYWHYDFRVKGRRFRGSTKTASRGTAELIESALRHEALLGAFTGKKPSHSLDDAFGRYWSDHAHRLASASNIAYQSENLLTGLGREVLLDRLDDDQVARYVAARRGQKDRHGNKFISEASVNRELTLLRAVVNMAAKRWGWATPVINWRDQWLLEPAPRDRVLSVEEARRLIACAAPHLKPAIEFSLLTGVRLDNCIRLDWSQIDLRARTITWKVKSRRPGGKPHVLPVSEPVLVLLANQGPHDKGPVFTYRRRKAAAARPVRKWQTAWAGALSRAKIEDFRWHDLRHTAASWMLDAGVPLDLVKEVLAHESITTTMRYAHRQPTRKREALESVGSYFGHSGRPDQDQAIDSKGETEDGAAAPKAGTLPD